MNLRTNRVFTIPNPKAWTHCTLPAYRPASWKASIDTGGVAITFVSVVPKQKGKTQVLRFRAADQYELRELIEQKYPDAVFSTAALPLPKDELKIEYQAQVQAEKDRQAAAQEEQDFARRVIEQHRLLASRMTPEEQQKHTNTNLNWLQTPESPYRDFFRQHPNFLAYPDNTNRNRETLLRWCSQRGYVIPLHAELCEGMRYLLERNHFAMKPTFKRSERDELRAVRDFVQEESDRFSPEQIAAATKRLRAALPVGSVPSMELIQAKAKQLGIENDLLQAVLNVRKEVVADTRGMNAAELKRGLQQSRNAARPKSGRPQQISEEQARTMPLDELKKEMRKGFRVPDTIKGY